MMNSNGGHVRIDGEGAGIHASPNRERYRAGGYAEMM
jgi:hypothetical protein